MEYKLPTTPEEYIAMVQSFAGLADAEMVRAEEEQDMHTLALRLPGLISIVNVIGYLRGQDNFFLDVRPSGLGAHQSDLYALEDAFEKRLNTLIEKVEASPEAENLKTRLETYYILARLGNIVPQESESAGESLEKWTVNLSEVRIDPLIPEDKTFESTSITELESIAVDYINAAYPGRYPNSITLDRLVTEAMRDSSGKTKAENIEQAFASPEIDTPEIITMRKSQDELDREYELKRDDLEFARMNKQLDDAAYTAKLDELLAEKKRKDDAIWGLTPS